MTLSDFAGLIIVMARFLISVGIVIGVIFIVWAGIMYMTAGDDIARAEAAKHRIKKTILGLLVVLAVGLIIQTLASFVNVTTFFNT